MKTSSLTQLKVTTAEVVFLQDRNVSLTNITFQVNHESQYVVKVSDSK